MARSDLFRIAAVIVLVAVLIATLATMSRRPVTRVVERPPTVAPPPDDLTAELRHCGALGPQDAEDAHCIAVWEENRQRFFGRPARPLPPQTPPVVAAPAISAPGGAR